MGGWVFHGWTRERGFARTARIAGGIGAALVCALIAVGGPPDASAHALADDARSAARATTAQIEDALGDDFERTRRGLFRVRLPDGRSLLTHGPDPKQAMNPLDFDGVGPSNASMRQPVCATDNYQHVLYAHLAAAPNLVAVEASTIRTAIRQINALLNAESLASGGVSADYKVLCDATGEIRVDSFATPSDEFGDVVAAARAQGFSDPRADYTIFLDAPSTFCGIGSYVPDSALAPNNRSNSGGGYGISYQGCWLDETPMHENAHNQGAVQGDAPSSTGTGGHCFEERDVMCYSPDGGDRHQEGTVSRCTNRVAFDCGDDDYFDSAPEAGEYLSSHWNLGSRLNRFIAFGQGTQVEPACGNRDCAPEMAPDGSARHAMAAMMGGWAFYRVVAPKATSISAAIDGPDCGGDDGCLTDLDLYVRAGKVPTTKRWDCRALTYGSDESCKANRTRSRVWYLGVRSAGADPGATFSIWAVPTTARKPKGKR
jgi:hypothetical protein